ncbi:MAG: hypothetical protein JXA24_02650 [Proteobacteria bacterium]|nr:hypothetical protein [Pseudomonadota bacterium]
MKIPAYIMIPRGLLAALIVIAAVAASGCSGEDYTPVYFPPPGDGEKQGPDPSVSGRACTLSFTSRLCVKIKGDNIEVGLSDDDALCTEVPPFPLHISGSAVTIEGSEFPDMEIEGHGLPAPITINARGDGDGSGNTGTGTVDAAGNMKIEGFSLYIVALGIVGEVPRLTFTTGATEELEHLPSISGSPPDGGGAMTLVTATTLGHIIDAADEYLLGASLTASFRGAVTPTLAECGGDSERTFEVQRVAISPEGKQTLSALPDGKLMEIGRGTFIAEDEFDVGPRFEASDRFKVTNASSRAQAIAIPPQKGPFRLSSTIPLSGQISPQQSFMLTASFMPTSNDAQPGRIIETITIGPDAFQLAATALSKSGSAGFDVIAEDGAVVLPETDRIDVGEAAVPANAERRFFNCQKISCEGGEAFTSCGPCPDPATMPCELLQVSTEGRPMAEVDAECNPVDPDATPMYAIDLKGSSDLAISGRKQVIALRNKGVKDMTIKSVTIEEAPGSLSTGQFKLPPGAIFAADDFSKVQDEVNEALAGGAAQGTPLPFALPPYQPGYQQRSAYIVVTYTPSDLVGADGAQAGVGSSVKDRAILRITTDLGDITAEVSGSTTISESPALELHFRTASGTKHVADGGEFPFKGITAQTVDAAVPLFLRVPDTAGSTVRVTGISVSGPDAANFRWLGTAEEIAAVKPPPGKGMRCSVPTVDGETGDLVSEEFDLKPVSIAPPGFDIAPGAYSTATMPLMGCVDFHRGEGEAAKRLFEGEVAIDAVELAPSGLPKKNPDGSEQRMRFAAKLMAAIEPRSGKFVLRVTQTSAAMLNPQFPGLSAISSYDDMKAAAGKEPAQADLQLFTGAMVLDPFDEMTITSGDASRTLSVPNDGVTAVFRIVDTHPVSQDYSEEALFDYANLIHDSLLPAGSRGVYEDYPNVPENARANGWRIYTSTLSYPGPLAPPAKVPNNPSDCVVVNPCDPEQLKLFTEAGAGAGKGACAFFYASGGRYDSPAFHTAAEMEGGEYTNLCKKVDKPQALIDIDTGRFSVDGEMTFEEAGMRFFGPTYFHNPGGPLGSKPAMDAVFHLAFTTGVLRPRSSEADLDLIPDEKVDVAGGEHKINLNDPSLATPPICEQNTGNWIVGDKAYSKWRYLEGLLFKDEEGTIPAGCPEQGNGYTGGQAFLRGKPVDPETGNVTVVAAAKFGSSDELTFAFKDVMMFIVLNGWFCDPEGSEELLEGPRCFDQTFNERDAMSQKSIIAQ